MNERLNSFSGEKVPSQFEFEFEFLLFAKTGRGVKLLSGVALIGH
jgi:hypothetical protein